MCAYIILLLFILSPVSGEIIKIGAIFEQHYEYLQWPFRLAVDQINRNATLLPNMKLKTSVAILKKNDGFFSTKKACEMISEGVSAIFGPQSVRTTTAVQEMAESAGIPLIINRWEYRTKPSNTTVFLHPHADTKGLAFRDFIETKQWKTFAIIYQDPKALIRLNALLTEKKFQGNFNIRTIQIEHREQFKKVFKETNKQNIKNFVIDIPTQDVIYALEQANELGMIGIYYNYFFTSLDVHTLDFHKFADKYCNITMFQVVNNSLPRYQVIEQELRTEIAHIGLKEAIDPYLNNTQFALIYDAVFYFASALTKLGPYFRPDPMPRTCYAKNTWAQGKQIVDTMKSIYFDGLTGVIKLDENGFRTDFNLIERRVFKDRLIVDGSWNKTHKFTPFETDDLAQSKEILSGMVLRVSSVENNPYLMKSENYTDDNPQYTGHSVALVERLAKLANFTFELHVVKKGEYGKLVNGEWNGMIGELVKNKADMVVADLTVTEDRQSVVDFTAPYMTLGIGILYRKPNKKDTNFFFFLSPFSIEVWFYMATAIVGVTIVMYLMGRLTPYEWVNPHPCDQEPEVLENQFTLQETAWIVVGGFLQQGGDISPIATSTRMAIGYWWFFTLIIVSSYTANLAALFTSVRLEGEIKSAEDLVTQTKVQYGCVAGGSTEKFFKNSDHALYSRMWTAMESAEPKVFAEDNDKGKERVRMGNYAFFMESTTIEYVIATNCDLMKIGDTLDEKNYAIATPKGSPIREVLSHSLLKLQELGSLKLLKDKWWKGASKCPKEKPPSDTLGLENIGGVFLILTIGLPLACIAVLIEFYLEKRKMLREERGPICVELYKELKSTVMGKNTIKSAPLEAEDEEKIISSKPISSSSSSSCMGKSTIKEVS